MNGDFGKYLVKDIYGNDDFSKDKVIEMPRINNLQEYEEDRKRQKDLKKVMSTGSLMPTQRRQGVNDLKRGKLHLSKN